MVPLTTPSLIICVVLSGAASGAQIHTFRAFVNATGFGSDFAEFGLTTLGYNDVGVVGIEPTTSPLPGPVVFDSNDPGFDAIANKMTDGIEDILRVRFEYTDVDGERVFPFIGGHGRFESRIFGTPTDLIGRRVTKFELQFFSFRVTPSSNRTTAIWNIYSVPEPSSLAVAGCCLLALVPTIRSRPNTFE